MIMFREDWEEGRRRLFAGEFNHLPPTPEINRLLDYLVKGYSADNPNGAFLDELVKDPSFRSHFRPNARKIRNGEEI